MNFKSLLSKKNWTWHTGTVSGDLIGTLKQGQSYEIDSNHSKAMHIHQEEKEKKPIG